jgi:hypothetical protein
MLDKEWLEIRKESAGDPCCNKMVYIMDENECGGD